MDVKKLKTAEAIFMAQYPQGFESAEMANVSKRHNMSKLVEFAQSSFTKRKFNDAAQICESMVKLIGRSSMVSMFEKPKFRDFVKCLDSNEQHFLANAMKRLLHGKQETGFEALVELLATQKLAKWSLVSAVPAYFAPDVEVFVKPTTAKGVVAHFELDALVYRPRPYWAFYQGYRSWINEAKKKVDHRLSPSNPAFTGFLMMAMKQMPDVVK
ncbi:MAG: hypothetical protein KJP25_06535 [Gammaproteobacteria bacterium]|nr:hypothetical protein [Gammaproteobacteria bacterium]MBT8150919.1 hypothetical protein [Gammaproteobacteria bacterium]NND38393.1 hypothetical protein [Pseudomonadales bacterium]NNM11196.1 hypothetical protein [Pseudomonadales bacterium]RZV51722.1 MAG: hypothetical protein EX270_10145 [Pseudomonadales bacterium]